MPDGANTGAPSDGSMSLGWSKGSFVQGYNAQIAVDSASQVIVAAEVTQETNDKKQLLPMLAQIAANLGQKPEKVSADTGYFSAANVTDEQVKDVDLYVATGRDKHGDVVETNSDPPPPGASPKEAMREKLRTEAGRAVYKMRKAIVEPVFGQVKEQRGFRRFSLRGKEDVSREWKLVCAVSNLLKLFRAGVDLERA
jgi:IS5 family transposase